MLKVARISLRLPRQAAITQALRLNATAPPPKTATPPKPSTPPAPKSEGNGFLLAILGAAGLGAAYFYTQQEEKLIQSIDFYKQVAGDIAEILDNVDYDDGSYGPLFVRLAWHASGTYDKASNTGGSQGATMRFKPESSDGANAGLGQVLDQMRGN